jgi:hypothetical protein
MRLTVLKAIRIGLDNFVILQEKQSRDARGHASNEALCLLKRRTQQDHRRTWIYRLAGLEFPPLLPRVIRISADFRDQSLRWMTVKSTMSRTSRRPPAAITLLVARSLDAG